MRKNAKDYTAIEILVKQKRLLARRAKKNGLTATKELEMILSEVLNG